MFDDFKELLSAFNAHSVEYLVVSGYAVSFHAQPRATKDLDLFIKADHNPALRLLRPRSADPPPYSQSPRLVVVVFESSPPSTFSKGVTKPLNS
jgi:hypothetical protein